MIAFSCRFIAAFASIWGPLVWTVVSEMYPTRYRAVCIGIATASNWIFTFLIAFFTSLLQQELVLHVATFLVVVALWRYSSYISS